MEGSRTNQQGSIRRLLAQFLIRDEEEVAVVVGGHYRLGRIQGEGPGRFESNTSDRGILAQHANESHFNINCGVQKLTKFPPSSSSASYQDRTVEFCCCCWFNFPNRPTPTLQICSKSPHATISKCSHFSVCVECGWPYNNIIIILMMMMWTREEGCEWASYDARRI